MGVEEQAFHSEALGMAEELYAQFLLDPQSVPPGWREYFAAQPVAAGTALGPEFTPQSIFHPAGQHKNGAGNGQLAQAYALQDQVDQIVRAYRVSGHLAADIDPLGRPRPEVPHLDPRFYGFTEADLERTISSKSIAGPRQLTLRQAIERLRNTYCRAIGVQFMHIDDLSVRELAAGAHGGHREPH